jgi:hypothetical protein
MTLQHLQSLPKAYTGMLRSAPGTLQSIHRYASKRPRYSPKHNQVCFKAAQVLSKAYTGVLQSAPGTLQSIHRYASKRSRYSPKHNQVCFKAAQVLSKAYTGMLQSTPGTLQSIHRYASKRPRYSPKRPRYSPQHTQQILINSHLTAAIIFVNNRNTSGSPYQRQREKRQVLRYTDKYGGPTLLTGFETHPNIPHSGLKLLQHILYFLQLPSLRRFC